MKRPAANFATGSSQGKHPEIGPLLRTERLVLDPLRTSDSRALGRLFAQKDVRRHLAVGALTPAQALNFADEVIERSRDELAEAGYAALAIRLTVGGEARGYCGLRPLPDRITAVELVFALDPSLWGRGLATEAVRCVLHWGRTIAGVREVVGLCRAENARSRSVMLAAGMREDGQTERYYGETLTVYRIAASRQEDDV